MVRIPTGTTPQPGMFIFNMVISHTRLFIWRPIFFQQVVAKAREILFDVNWFRAEAENQEKHLSDTRSVDPGHYRSPHLDEDVPER